MSHQYHADFYNIHNILKWPRSWLFFYHKGGDVKVGDVNNMINERNENMTVTYLNRANNWLKAMHSEGKRFVWIGISFVFLLV